MSRVDLRDLQYVWSCRTRRVQCYISDAGGESGALGPDGRFAACLDVAVAGHEGLIIITVTMLGLGFPFDPAQVALTTFTVGAPAFFLVRAVWRLHLFERFLGLYKDTRETTP